MGTKLEDLFKTLRRGRAPSLGFAHSEAADGERMIVGTVCDSAVPSAISSAVSAGAKIVLVPGDSSTHSRGNGKLVKVAGSALVGVIEPDLGDDPGAALAGLSKLGVGFVVVDPDRTPARVLTGEGPEIVVRQVLGLAQPPPARLTPDLEVGGAAISVLKQPDGDPSLTMTDLALLKQFCASSRRPTIFMAHAGVGPEDAQILYDHGVECVAVEAGATEAWVDAVRAIGPRTARRESEEMVPFLPKIDGSEDED